MSEQMARRIGVLPPSGDEVLPLNIFRTMAHNEDLSAAFLRLGGHLLRAGVLPEREREIVILRTGWRAGSEYEFGQHTAIGLAAGLTSTEVDRIADCGDDAGWAGEDQALVNMVDELCDDDIVSDKTWAALQARWSESELLELLVLTGFYRLVSGMLNSAGVPLEPATSGWPIGSNARLTAPRDLT